MAWLDAHAGRLVRVPLTLDEAGDLARARLAGLTVHADDAALGIGLADRGTASFLVDGYWRGNLRLDVIHATELADPAWITHAELEEGNA